LRTFFLLLQLIINSLYGKLIESVSKRSIARFNRDIVQAMRNATSPLFTGEVIYNEDFSISYLKKKFLQMNKTQWAVGFSILEISKLIMQTLFYEGIQPKFGVGNVDVLMSDTDSFLLRVVTDKTENECMRELEEFMDFSNYPSDHPLFNNIHAKVPGRFKNELPNKKIVSFVGLKSKTYHIGVEGEENIMKAKGVPGRAKKKINPQSMLDCLKEMSAYKVTFRRIASQNHIVKLVENTKTRFHHSMINVFSFARNIPPPTAASM
jgi:hypothetical protein